MNAPQRDTAPELVPVACDICGGDSHLPVHGIGRGGVPLPTVICRRCGFVFTSPRPAQERSSDRYTEGTFSLEARGAATPDQGKMLRSEVAALARLEHIETLLGVSRRDGRVLEVGCGIGSFVRGMRGFGWQAVGIEPDPGYRAFGVASYAVDIRAGLYGVDVRADGPQDMICAFHVLEQLWSPRATLGQMREDLVADGHLYLEVPTLERPLGGDLDRFFWAPHLSSFSAATLTGLLGDVGFDVRAHGHRGNALWVLARRAEPAKAPLRLPLDRPDRVVAELARKHADFVRAEAQPQLLRLASRVRAQPRIMASKAYEAGRDELSRGRATVALALRRRVSPELVHLGVHHGGNAGDSALFDATRRILDQERRHAWRLLPLRKVVDRAMLDELNRTRGVVLGGGGLFLRDTNANDVSGWQWPCPLPMLDALRVPLVLFAIGYNRFRGQGEFEPVFAENVAHVIDKAGFVGLRNFGSIRAVKGYLPEALHDKLSYQPCATTMLGCYLPAWRHRPRPHRRTLVLNAAFDRPQLRYEQNEVEVLRQLADATRYAQELGYRIRLALHSTGDDNIVPWLRRARVDFEPVQLTRAPASRVLTVYRDADLAVGMRGHAQMIPFGLGTPILSVVSHDKLAWFLDDIGHAEWGFDVRDPELGDRLRAGIAQVAAEPQAARLQIEEARERLWDLTRANVARIDALFR